MHVAKFWQLTNLNPYIIITYTDKHIEMQKWRNWQTRTVQVRMVAILCGFKSHLPQSILHLLFRLTKAKIKDVQNYDPADR